MDLKEVMAINLRRIRHVKKMTQEDLADSAGLSVRYVGAIERADVSASVTVLGRIAKALGVEATDLIKRTAVHPLGLDDEMHSCSAVAPSR
ncbi:helix-turn-helix domain-containing protein [Bradyrhizobium sp. 195]|uniref:helix-turn-helix domain-containing protein n=1 Tax=Bradyrhizobium sp. 195 TaxID=2782662 RepID=UPI002001CD99|nr:helix-turn-helix transcriptional regulator [Bradyrhizobium sp. 195]UPK26511.1 helix-turn-helix transcriptional regulator [Bradyrhizobium sp. 195]